MTRDGLLIVDKPSGATSADVVRVVKRVLRCKTGHLGTLDPFATGVLPLCLGEGTKLAPFLNEDDKEYEGVIRLGRSTDTGDVTGSTSETAAVPAIDADTLAAVARRFHGDQLQTPPMYSALKREGVPLYKLARRGIEVERQARSIVISEITLALVDASGLRFHVACSKGTYVRVLAGDIARALGTVGHVESLRRTRFGCFGIAQAVALDQVGNGPEQIIGLRDSLPGMREVVLDSAAAQRARGGYEPVLRSLASGRQGEHAKLVDPDGDLVAVVVSETAGSWRFARVFVAASDSSITVH